MTSKTWEFTLNNPTTGEEEFLKELGSEVSYLGYGAEEGENGTPHFQGRIIFRRSYRLAQLKKLLPRAHWEKTLASQDNLYIKKCIAEGREFVEVDNRNPGKRNDLEALIPLCREGKFADAANADPKTFAKFEQFLRRVNAIKNVSTAPRDPSKPPEVFWLWGPAGVGKTRAVWQRECELQKNSDEFKSFGVPSLWMSGSNLTYFEGYENQDAVLIDDFRPDMCTLTTLLRMTDRYPLRVNVKHSSREWNPQRIYVTAPCGPRDFFPKYSDLGAADQLLRRLTKCIEVKENAEVEF